MSEYPRMLYRTGDMIRWEGLGLDHRIVADANEQAQAEKEGWRIGPHPLDRDGDGQKGGSLPKRKTLKAKP